MVLDASLFNTQYYKVQIKCKWSNPGKGVPPFLTLRSSSCWKGSFRVALDDGRPTTTIEIRGHKKKSDYGRPSLLIYIYIERERETYNERYFQLLRMK